MRDVNRYLSETRIVEEEEQETNTMRISNPFHSEKSNLEFDGADLFVYVLLPMIPLFGFVGIAGSTGFLLIDGSNEYGTADVAVNSTLWGLFWQILWIGLWVIA